MKKTQCAPLKEDHAMSRENKQERDNMQKSTVDSSTAETSVAQYNESVELATQFKIKLSSEFQLNNEVRTESCDKDTASDETKVYITITFLIANIVVTIYNMIHLNNLASICSISYLFYSLFLFLYKYFITCYNRNLSII